MRWPRRASSRPHLNFVPQCLLGPKTGCSVLQAHTAFAICVKATHRVVLGAIRAYLPAEGRSVSGPTLAQSEPVATIRIGAAIGLSRRLRSGLPNSGSCLAQEPAPNMSLKLTRYGKAARPRSAPRSSCAARPGCLAAARSLALR